MPDKTFLTPDHSQVVLRIHPAHTVWGWFMMSVLLCIDCVMFIPLCLEFSNGNFTSDQVFVSLTFNVVMTFIFLRIILTDDLLTLTHEGFTYRKKGFTTKVQFFPFSSIAGFEQVWKSSGKNGYYTIQINLKDQNSIEISNVSWVSKKNQQIFIDECEEFLRRQKRAIEVLTPAGEKDPDDPMEVIHLKTDRLIFAEQPMDSEWTRDEEASEFTIYKNGKFSLGNFLSTLFICAFWNGIVSIFVLNLFGVIPGGVKNGFAWWVQFLFLIPFEVIGVVLFVAVLGSLFAAWGTEKWIFTRNEIRKESKSLGIRTTKRFDVSLAAKLEIEPDGLFFVSDGGEEEEKTLCEIPLASQAEARWLAARFQQMRGWW